MSGSPSSAGWSWTFRRGAAGPLAAGASLATRNTEDFHGTGVELINPWE